MSQAERTSSNAPYNHLVCFKSVSLEDILTFLLNLLLLDNVAPQPPWRLLSQHHGIHGQHTGLVSILAR